MKLLRILILAGLVAATPALANEAGDVVFSDRGPWQLSESGLVWTISQTGPEAEGFTPLGSGTVTLTQTIDPSDGKPVLQLAEDTARIKRKIGPFPISGGDPTLTFFLETVTRDMAALTGGSPFYIRNRLKDALFRAGDLQRQGDSLTATFTPFKGDKNHDRMFGFEALELQFKLGDPKQPIRSMVARTGPLAGGKPAYVNEMVLK